MSQSTISQALHFVCTTNVDVVVFIIYANTLISNDTSNIIIILLMTFISNFRMIFPTILVFYMTISILIVGKFIIEIVLP